LLNTSCDFIKKIKKNEIKLLPGYITWVQKEIIIDKRVGQGEGII
jgi:hypothetical protein